jgi:hypothetical protein
MKKFQIDNMEHFFNDSDGLYYWDVYTKFIFLPTDFWDTRNLEKLCWKLFEVGILNFLVSNNETHHYGYNIFNNQTYQVEMTQDISKIFPNKLRDLHGYSYRILLYPESPMSWWKNGKIHGAKIYFLEEMLKHQNATFHFRKMLSFKEASSYKTISGQLSKKEFDFCPNILVLVSWTFHKRISIETYTMTGYCALIPREPPKSFIVFLISPFDAWTWILMGLSVAIRALVYKLLDHARLSSGGQFVFGVFGLFLGQSANTFNARSRKNFYSQLFIFFAFLLGTAYLSLILTFLFQDRDVRSIKNFEDLKASDLRILTDEYFIYMNEEAGVDEKFQKRLRAEIFRDFDNIERGTALVMACDLAKYVDNHHKNLSATFYLLDELIYPFHIQYNTRVSNPFKEKIQDYVLRFMESGIADYFEGKYARFLNRKDRVHQSEASFLNEKTYLDFDDFFEIYKILLIGYLAAFVAFVFEWIVYLSARFCENKNT